MQLYLNKNRAQVMMEDHETGDKNLVELAGYVNANMKQEHIEVTKLLSLVYRDKLKTGAIKKYQGQREADQASRENMQTLAERLIRRKYTQEVQDINQGKKQRVEVLPSANLNDLHSHNHQ